MPDGGCEETTTSRDGADEATLVHQDPVAQSVYIAEVDRVARADLVIDNHDWAAPSVLRWSSAP